MRKYRIINIYYYDLDDLTDLMIANKNRILNGELTLLNDQHFENVMVP